MKYIYSTSQMSKLSLTLHTFSITSSVAGLFLTGSNIVFDTSIRYDKHGIRTIERALIDILKFIAIFISYFVIFVIYYIKRKVIRKYIYQLKA